RLGENFCNFGGILFARKLSAGIEVDHPSKLLLRLRIFPHRPVRHSEKEMGVDQIAIGAKLLKIVDEKVSRLLERDDRFAEFELLIGPLSLRQKIACVPEVIGRLRVGAREMSFGPVDILL